MLGRVAGTLPWGFAPHPHVARNKEMPGTHPISELPQGSGCLLLEVDTHTPLSGLGLPGEHLSGQDGSAPSSLCPPPPNVLICLGLPTPFARKDVWLEPGRKQKKRTMGGMEAVAALPACAQSP